MYKRITIIGGTVSQVCQNRNKSTGEEINLLKRKMIKVGENKNKFWVELLV